MRKLFHIIYMVFCRFFKERYTYHASALAFTTLLALVPLLSVIFSFISAFPFFTRFMNLSREYILANFIPTSQLQIEQYLENFIHQAGRLSPIGIIFLIITTWMLLLTIEHTLDDIWQNVNRRRTLFAFVKYWVILLLTPIFMGLSVFISSYLFSLSFFVKTIQGLHLPLLSIIPLLLNILFFSLLYSAVPNYRVTWYAGLFGGLMAALLFELAKFGFVFYLKYFGGYELIYGTLAIIPIFLIWLYVVWLIILFGALVTNVITIESEL